MSDRVPSKTQQPRRKRHPLLFQQRLSEQYFWPAILIVATSGALLAWNPARLEPYRFHLAVALICCGLVLILTFAFRLRAYATLTEDAIRVRLPFHGFEIPYRDIRNVRPTELFRMFPPPEQRWTRRRFLEPLFGATVVVIELDQLPRPAAWLRLWLTPYMVCPDKIGIIIAVRDWMGFRADLDEYRARLKRPSR